MSLHAPMNVRRQAGSGLLVLSILMIVLGLVAVVVLALLPNQGDEQRIEDTIATVEGSKDAILGFVVDNYRLPDPDTDADGGEDDGAATGALPYRSMGLPAAVLDEASIPLRYTPYRNASASVDLAEAVALYEPDLPDTSDLQDQVLEDGTYSTMDGVPTIDECTIADSPVNLLDFCVALENAIAAGAAATSVNVGPDDGNVAYAVLSGGLEDADGNGADRHLDGPNDDGDLSYEDPARGRGAGYDDVVRAARFSSLQRELSCVPLVDSVDLLAAVANGSKSVLETTIAAYNTSELTLLMADIAVLMDIVAIAQTVQAGIGVAADIAKTAGGCASIILSANCCPALAGNIARAVVYAVTAVVQIVKLAVDVDARDAAEATRDLYRDTIVPGANDHLCSAIAETTAADARSGLAPGPSP